MDSSTDCRRSTPTESQRPDANGRRFWSPVWQLKGLLGGSEPGVLTFADGRLSFTTEERVAFEAPASAFLDLTFPWYDFGGGLKLRVDGRPYRLSFVKPNGAADVSGRLLARAGNPLAAALTVGRKVRDINQGVRAGRTWKALLSR